MNLKTLKDLYEEDFLDGMAEGIYETLRKEAIKWIKLIRKKQKQHALFEINGIKFYYSKEREDWIKHFFNIKDSDLK